MTHILKGSYYAFSRSELDSVCSEYVGHKAIDKATNLKVHSKERYFVFKNPFQELQRTLVWTTKLFSCICDITKIILPTETLMFGLVELSFQNQTPSKLLANHNAPGQLTNHNTFSYSEGGASSDPELMES